MLPSLARLIERHPGLHRAALRVWRQFPPRLAGFLKGRIVRNWLVGAVAVIVDDEVSPPQILLVKHGYRPRGAWGLPGGALESGELRPRSPEIVETRLVPLTEIGGYDLVSPNARFIQRDLTRLVPSLSNSRNARAIRELSIYKAFCCKRIAES